MIKLERILIPTDFSGHSKQAGKYACELAKRFTAELHLLHVVEPLILPESGGLLPPDVIIGEERSQEELEKVKEPGFDHATRVIRKIKTGTPFVEIVRYARDNDIDLIVLGTHGRSGLIHALMGSVAEKVVRKAPCPVLTVRPEGHQFVLP
jgi:nucleotide-binding universal stress UspA family protein